MRPRCVSVISAFFSDILINVVIVTRLLNTQTIRLIRGSCCLGLWMGLTRLQRPPHNPYASCFVVGTPPSRLQTSVV